MTQPAKSQEPSMEEILASIRRIIADDDATKSASRVAEPPRPAPPPQRILPEPAPPALHVAEEELAEAAAVDPLDDEPAEEEPSDILDLTEIDGDAGFRSGAAVRDASHAAAAGRAGPGSERAAAVPQDRGAFRRQLRRQRAQTGCAAQRSAEPALGFGERAAVA